MHRDSSTNPRRHPQRNRLILPIPGHTEHRRDRRLHGPQHHELMNLARRNRQPIRPTSGQRLRAILATNVLRCSGARVNELPHGLPAVLDTEHRPRPVGLFFRSPALPSFPPLISQRLRGYGCGLLRSNPGQPCLFHRLHSSVGGLTSVLLRPDADPQGYRCQTERGPCGRVPPLPRCGPRPRVSPVHERTVQPPTHAMMAERRAKFTISSTPARWCCRLTSWTQDWPR